MAEADKTAGTGRRTVRVGVVSSTGGDKTIRVIVRTQVKHPVYGKIMRRSTKVAVDDPQNAAGLGDVVEITPCRRISKTKSWRLMRVIRKITPVPPLPTEQG
jgi:small subunit ribosomal protein S17